LYGGAIYYDQTYSLTAYTEVNIEINDSYFEDNYSAFSGGVMMFKEYGTLATNSHLNLIVELNNVIGYENYAYQTVNHAADTFNYFGYGGFAYYETGCVSLTVDGGTYTGNAALNGGAFYVKTYSSGST
jgi:hypothetical protein